MSKIPQEFTDRLILGDAARVMRLLPTESVHLTVTSPPYGDMRTYGGHTWDCDAVIEELFRITAPGGVVVWIVQEQVIDGVQTGTSSAQRLLFQEVGFSPLDIMPMVVRVGHYPRRDAYANCYHQAIVSSKGRPRSLNIIRDRPNKHVGRTKRTMKRTVDGHVLRFKELRIQPVGARGNVWNYDIGCHHTTRDRYAYDHPAIMPERMAEDHIVSWSRPGDLVLDPFAGAATTCKMALLNDRRYLGIEINDDYIDIATRRMREAHVEYARRLDEALGT